MEACEPVLAVDPLKRAPFHWFPADEGPAHLATSRWKHRVSRHSQTGDCSRSTGTVYSPGVQPPPSPWLDKSLSKARHPERATVPEGRKLMSRNKTVDTPTSSQVQGSDTASGEGGGVRQTKRVDYQL